MSTRSEWQQATVVSRERVAGDMVAIRIEPREPLSHHPGQHYEVRLPSGELSRKYSIVSSPSSLPIVELGVQILPTGLLSPRLAKVAAGDLLEIRGPLGRAFRWVPSAGGNLLLLGAGAGITPLLSMWSFYHETGVEGVCHFTVSAKGPERVYRYDRYRDRLDLRFTSERPRLGIADVEAILAHMPRAGLSVRICGPSGFTSTMVDALIELGIEETCIRSEGFA